MLPTLNGHILKLIEEISIIFKTQKKNFEIVVVDDNSSDGTYESVKKFQTNNSYLKVILRKDKKKNLANSINDGIMVKI